MTHKKLLKMVIYSGFTHHHEYPLGMTNIAIENGHL